MNVEEQQKVWDEELAIRESEAADPQGPQSSSAKPEGHEPNPAPQDQQTTVAPQTPVEGGQQTQAQETPPSQEQKAPTTEELLAAALARIDKLEGRTRNVEGHIGGLTKSQKDLREAMVNAGKASQAAATVAPTDEQIAAAAQNPKEWDDLKEDFPEWASATEKFLTARLSAMQGSVKTDDVQKLVNEAIARNSEELSQKIVDSALNAVLPKWKSEINSDRFKTWMASQPDDIKALAASEDIGDAVTMLTKFKTESANPAVGQILQSRQQKLANAQVTQRGVRTPAVKTPDQMTPDELWNYEWAQRQKKKASA